jgi:Flp pilus assembly protein TadD
MRALPVIRLLITVAVLAPLGFACAVNRHHSADRAAARLDHEIRSRGVDPDRIGNPLEYDESMRDAARGAVGAGSALQRLRDLQVYLFDESRFPFDYRSRATYTAREAFDRREGNCVAFTSLFIAMARSIGIDVRAAVITTGDAEREGDLIIVNQHMVAIYEHSGGATAFDFNLRAERTRLGLELIDDLWVVAIHASNRGVEQLVEGRNEDARRLFETALLLAPDFAPAHGNLGLALRRSGDLEGAFAAYERALDLAPGSPTVLNNVAALYRSLGMEAEAVAALAAAKRKGSTAFMLLVRGDLERREGRTDRAIRLYRRAARVDPELAEPWIAIARAETARGEDAAARKALRKALRIAPDSVEAHELLERLGN